MIGIKKAADFPPPVWADTITSLSALKLEIKIRIFNRFLYQKGLFNETALQTSDKHTGILNPQTDHN